MVEMVDMVMAEVVFLITARIPKGSLPPQNEQTQVLAGSYRDVRVYDCTRACGRTHQCGDRMFDREQTAHAHGGKASLDFMPHLFLTNLWRDNSNVCCSAMPWSMP